jgi:hypothetical protein
MWDYPKRRSQSGAAISLHGGYRRLPNGGDLFCLLMRDISTDKVPAEDEGGYHRIRTVHGIFI